MYKYNLKKTLFLVIITKCEQVLVIINGYNDKIIQYIPFKIMYNANKPQMFNNNNIAMSEYDIFTIRPELFVVF